ncbi:MAG: cation diffusion facilitator family transporter [Patescibacteria group bacterium]|nr:cation diffusion facilitator family transporter [Patescibacteria group bacterium]
MTHKRRISARRVIVTSFAVDFIDVVLNFGVALLSGSVVIFTEAMQGFADLLTSGLLWVGLHRSRKRANRKHQFGYGKELFFWILMAGLSMLVLTSGFSLYFGLQRLFHPMPIHHLPLAYAVLVIGFVTNTYAFGLSMRRLELRRRDGLKVWWQHIRASTFIETKATLILDLMGSVASVLGLISLIFYGITGDGRLDGLGAIVVGVCCAVFAVLLILEVKSFIVGRSASPEMEHRIKHVAEKVKGVHRVLDLRTMQMGSEKVMVNMEVHIDHNLKTMEIEQLMDDLKAAVKVDVPEVQHIQVEVETPRRTKGTTVA